MKNYRGQELVADCYDLEQLCERLNSIYERCREQGLKMEDVIDITSLPTFSLPEPEDTTGIYSWDEEYFLYADSDGFYLDKRELDRLPYDVYGHCTPIG